MTAAVYHIVIEQGATFRFSLVWKDGTGVPVNLTGYAARMQVRRSVADSATQLDLSTGNGAVTLGGAGGTIEIVAAASLTDAMTGRAGVYDLELTSSSGEVTRLVEGQVTISPAVTRG